MRRYGVAIVGAETRQVFPINYFRPWTRAGAERIVARLRESVRMGITGELAQFELYDWKTRALACPPPAPPSDTGSGPFNAR